nr:MAG TPA: leucine-rich repeat protein [Caudoviricetes sp.]
MSLNSEINRIKNAKAAIKTAVAAKGVDVGDGKLDTYAAKIGEIATSEDFVDLITGNITSVAISDGVTQLKAGVFRGCSKLQSATFPNTLRAMNNEAFQDCTSLTSIDLPASLISIGAYSFKNCTSLTHLTLPEANAAIENGVFDGCSKLQSLTIPTKVYKIGVKGLAIGSTGYPATITMKPTTPPTIQSNTIGENVAKIIVPAASYNAYITATNWAAHAGIIVAEDPVETRFLSALNMSSYGTEFQFPFRSNNEWYSKIKLVDGEGGGMWYDDTQVYYNTSYSEEQPTGWVADGYKTIDLFQTPDDSGAVLWLEECGVKLVDKWVLNAQPALPVEGDGQYQTFSTQFVSNNELLTTIRGFTNELRYGNTDGNTKVYTVDPPVWVSEAYRTVHFAETPSGALLTWLQGNGTKQE